MSPLDASQVLRDIADMVVRGEVLLWKHLAEFAEGRVVRSEAPYWAILRARRGR